MICCLFAYFLSVSHLCSIFLAFWYYHYLRHCIDSLHFYMKLQCLMIYLCLQIYIHPIAPVLNETRHIVVAFNKIYKKLVGEVKGNNIVSIKTQYF